MDRNNISLANAQKHTGKCWCYVAASCTYQLSSPSYSTIATQKAYLLMSNVGRIFLEQIRRISRKMTTEKKQQAQEEKQEKR